MDKKEQEELKEFLKNNKKSHFLQSPEWAKVKDNWKHEMIIVRNKENKITGTMSILLRKMPIINRYMMYAPRGFVCDIDDKETLEKLTKEAKEIAKKYKAFIFRLDPDIPNDNKEFRDLAQSLGYKLKKNIKTIDDVIQPKYVYRLNIEGKSEEELIKVFKEKTRYNIRLAGRKGVVVREGKEEDFSVFYEIMKETGKRDNFFIRDISYFKKLYDAMRPDHAKILIAEYENTPVAVAMPIYYGNKVWYLFGGSLNKHRKVMPTYLIQWEMMKWAIENNCDIYDFGGVSGYEDEQGSMYGVYRFKKGFNGEVVEFVDELYMVFNPFINTIWNMMFFCRKTVINAKIKIVEGMKKFGNKKR